MSPAICREELRAAIDDAHVTVVDALPPAPFGQRHLPGAINIVAENFDEQVRAALPDAAAAIVTYSTDERCTRGPELAARLRELGYRDVRTYEGGIEDWIAAGLPIESCRTDPRFSNDDALGSDTEPSSSTPGSDTEPSSSARAPRTAPVRLSPLPDGPYQVTGPLEITRPDGTLIPAPETAYLCRCGRSANKPFCDGSHARTGWTEHA